MKVTKRNGSIEEVNFDKINLRIKKLIESPYKLEGIDSGKLSQMVIKNIYDGIPTNIIDIYTANLSASLFINNINYGILASRISINNCHKNTLLSFSEKTHKLYNRYDTNNNHSPLLQKKYVDFVDKHKCKIEELIQYDRDYLFDFFGFKTLEKGYLLKINNNIIERPQDMYMRVAIYIHMDTDNTEEFIFDKIKQTYDLMSNKYYTHATPTLFNAATVIANLSSCFLLGTEDSLVGIMKTATDCAKISKYAGGIGIHVSNWRNEGSLIRSTNGKSNGIIPFLKVFNDLSRAFNQGGKRLGSFAIYLEPHHPDIMSFLELKRNQGDENIRARDLFLALWISDLFMDRVKNNKDWSTFNPDECKELNELYGIEYEKKYLQYEKNNKAIHTYKAREIWYEIFKSQKESGVPYILYKDNVNNYNNQSNLGIIKSSNLCCEITIYSDEKEYGVCNLASICLPKFVLDSYSKEESINNKTRRELNHEFPVNPYIDYKELSKIAGVICYNLNRVIDINNYPCEEAKKSSFKGRPIGIGVQGLADVFYKFKIPFDSEEAKIINKKIFEAIYYGAISESTKLSKEIYKKNKGCDKMIGAYPVFKNSPMYGGNLIWEKYNIKEQDLSGMFDWNTVKEHIKIYGLRNSLLTALMPTASTSHINGNTECFEPITSNMYKRKVLSGEFILINKYLINELNKNGLINDDMITFLKLNGGSIQNIEGLPDKFKKVYRTVWEIPQKNLIDMAIDRQPFIDQSQSMNLYFENFTFDKFNSAQFYAWNNKLKTGSYYVRTKASTNAQKFTIDPKKQLSLNNYSVTYKDNIINDDDDICLLCSS